MMDVTYACACDPNFNETMTVSTGTRIPDGLAFKIRDTEKTSSVILNNNDVRDLYNRLGEVLGKEPEQMFKANVNAEEIKLGDRVKATHTNGNFFTYTATSSKTLAGALVSRYDILKRPKALPTGRGARIAYTRMHSGEVVTLTLTANSRDSWRGYDRYGLTLALPPDYLIDNPARWELVKD